MADIITSNGLGLLDSIRTGIGRTNGLAQDGTRVAVNAHEGNLVVQHRDELLVGSGLDTAILRTYNSQGQFTDGNQDGFRFSFEEWLTINSAQPADPLTDTITRTSGDGHVATFTFDHQAGGAYYYSSTDGEGAHDSIVLQNGSYTWIEGSSQRQHVYVQSTVTGGQWRLDERIDVNGNSVQFHYDLGTDRLTFITADGSRALRFNYDPVYTNRVTEIDDGALGTAHNIATSFTQESGTGNVVSYSYDGSGRLHQVTHQVRSDDGDVDTNETFVTTYTYAATVNGNDKRVAQIDQYNGYRDTTTSTYFKYEHPSDETHVTSIRYGAQAEIEIIDDPLESDLTRVIYHDSGSTSDQYLVYTNSDGHVRQITSPLDLYTGKKLDTIFVYDVDGNLIERSERLSLYDVSTAGFPAIYENITGKGYYARYDDAGNVIREWDGAGGVVTYTYNSENRRLSQTVYVDKQLNPANAGTLNGTTRVTNYIYAANNIDLRFVVAPDGSVTEHRYTDADNKTGLSDSTVVYLEDRYTASTLTLAALEGWADDLVTNQSLQDNSVRRVDRDFNLMGMLLSETTYTDVDSNGVGVAATEQITRYGYDPRTGVLHHVIDANDSYLVNVLDHWGQTIRARQDVNLLPNAQDIANERMIFHRHPAGTTNPTSISFSQSPDSTRTYEQYDAAGRLIQRYQSTGHSTPNNDTAGEGAHASNVHFVYDAQGRLLAEHSPGVDPTLYLYNELGQRTGVIDGEGGLTVFHYTAGGELVETIRYSNGIDVSRLHTDFLSFDAVNGALTTVAETLSLKTLFNATVPYLSADASNDRHSYAVYDEAGRARFAIDALGYVTETRYNGVGQVTDRIAFHAPYTFPVDWSTRVNSARLSGLETFYGPIVANPNTRHEITAYDTAGRVSRVTDASGYHIDYVYNGADQLVKTSRLANTDGSASADDQHSYQIYDAAGQRVAAINAEGYLSTWSYRENGQLQQQTRFDNKVDSATIDTQSPVGIQLSELTIAGVAVQSIPVADQQHTRYYYNVLNDLVREVDHSGVITEYTYDLVGRLATIHRGTVDTNGNGEVDAGDDTSGRRLVSNILYDTLGRERRVETALANASGTGNRFIYDLAGRLVRSIDTGEQTTYYYYDDNDRLRFTINALGHVSETRYNVFGEATTTIDYATPVATSGLTGGALTNALESQLTHNTHDNDRQTDIAYTLRGLTKSIRDASYNAQGIPANQWTIVNYHTAFGEVRTRDQGNNNAPSSADYSRRTFTFDHRGLNTATDVTAVVNATPIAQVIQTSIDYDAFGRTTKSRDGNGHDTFYSYDRLGRLLTVTDPLSHQTVTTYDAFDRVLTQTDALGVVTTYSYDDINRSMTSSVTLSGGHVVQTETYYNVHGEVARIIDGEGHVTEYQYDANGNVTRTRVYERLGDIVPVSETSGAYDARNVLTSSIDANGVVTEYEYDALSRITSLTIDVLGDNPSVSTTAYNHSDRTITETNANTVSKVTTFDHSGRVERVVEVPLGLARLTRYTYDAEGLQVSEERGAVVNGVDEIRYRTHYEYDAFGRRISQTVDPGVLDITTRYEYDNNGNVVKRTDANEQDTYFVYNERNEQVYSIDPLGHVVEIRYNNNGQVTDQITYSGSIASSLSGWLTTHNGSPDVNDIQTFLDDTTVAGIIEAGEYATGSITQTVDLSDYSSAIELGSLSLEISGQYQSAADTGVRWVISFLSRDGNTVGLPVIGDVHVATGGIDNFNAVPVLVPEGADQAVISYSAFTAISKSSPPAATDIAVTFSDLAITADDATTSTVLSIHAPLRHIKSEYDNLGRISAEINDPDGLALTTRYLYDDSGNVVRRTDAKGLHTYYTYDAHNRLQYTVDALGFVGEVLYDLAGQVVEQRTHRDSIKTQFDLWLPGVDAIPDVADISQLLAQTAQLNGDYDRQLLSNIGVEYLVDGVVSDTSHGSIDKEHALVAVIENGDTQSGSFIQTIDLSAFNDSAIDSGEVELFLNGDFWAPSGTNIRWLIQYKNASGNLVGYPQLAFLSGVSAWQGFATESISGIVPAGAESVVLTLTGMQPVGAKGSTPVSEDTPVYFNDLVLGLRSIGDEAKPKEALAAQTRYIYDDLGRQRFVIDSLGFVTEDRFDTLGNVIETIAYMNKPELGHDLTESDVESSLTVSSSDRHTMFVYDNVNRLRFKVDDQGYVDELRYSTYGDLLNERRYDRSLSEMGITNPSYTQSFLVSALAGETSRASHYEYDRAGRRVKSVDAEQYVTETVYDDAGQVIRTLRRANETGTSLNDQFFDTVRDAAGRIVYEVDGESYVSEYRYDSNSQIKTEIRYADAINRGLGDSLSVSDVEAELESIDKDRYQQVSYLYDAVGRVIEEVRGDRVTGFVYDEAGNQIALKDARGFITLQTFDDVGRKESATNIGLLEGGSDGFTDEATQTIYDALGNIVKVIDARGGVGYFQYDTEGRIRFQIDPNGYVTEHRYDAFGNQVESIRYANLIQKLGDDSTDYWNHTLELLTVPPGEQAVDYLPDGAVWYLRLNANHDQYTTYTYDSLNRNRTLTDAEQGVQSYDYNSHGDVTQYIDQREYVTTYDYDKLGRQIEETKTITKASGESNAETVITEQVYDAFGNVTELKEAVAIDGSAQRVTYYTYNENNKLVDKTTPIYGGLSKFNGYERNAGTAYFSFHENFGEYTFYFYDDAIETLNALADGPLVLGYAFGWNDGTVADFQDALEQGTVVEEFQYVDDYYEGEEYGEFSSSLPYEFHLYMSDTLPLKLYKEIGGVRYEVMDLTAYAPEIIELPPFEYVVNDYSASLINRLYLTDFDDGSQTLWANIMAAGTSTPIVPSGSFTRQDDGFYVDLHALADGDYQIAGVSIDENSQLVNLLNGSFSKLHGRVINIVIDTQQGSDRVTSFDTDAYGNVISEEDANGKVTYHYYDDLNRRISTVDAERYLQEFAYDEVGNLVLERRYNHRIKPDVDLTSIPGVADLDAFLDADDSPSQTIDLLQTLDVRETYYVYDAANRLIEERVDNVYVYGVDDNTGAITDGYQSLRTTNRYDANGNTVHIVQPNGSESFAMYDKNNNLIAEVDGEGYFKTYEYDNNNSLTKETAYATSLYPRYPSLLQALRNTQANDFDSDVKDVLVYTYMTFDAEADRETIYRYDKLNRQTETRLQNYDYSEFTAGDRTIHGNQERVFLYEYDTAGNVIQITNPDGGEVDKEYDGLSRLILEQQPQYENELGNFVRSRTAIQYDALGNIVAEIKLGDDGDPDAIDYATSYRYDSLGNRVAKTDSEGWQTHYFHDANGNIISEYDVSDKPGYTPKGLTKQYDYDNFDRLETTHVAGEQEVNVYNGYGDIVSRGRFNADRTEGRDDYQYYIYDSAGRVIKTNQLDGVDRAYLYDANGNLTADITVTIAPNEDGTIAADDVLYGGLLDTDIANIASFSATNSGRDEINRIEYRYDNNNNRIATIEKAVSEVALTEENSEIVTAGVLDDPFQGGTLNISADQASFRTEFVYHRSRRDNDRHQYWLTYYFDVPSTGHGESDYYLFMSDGTERRFSARDGEFSYTTYVHIWLNTSYSLLSVPVRIEQDIPGQTARRTIADFSSPSIEDAIRANNNQPAEYTFDLNYGSELRLSGLPAETERVELKLWQPGQNPSDGFLIAMSEWGASGQFIADLSDDSQYLRGVIYNYEYTAFDAADQPLEIYATGTPTTAGALTGTPLPAVSGQLTLSSSAEEGTVSSQSMERRQLLDGYQDERRIVKQTRFNAFGEIVQQIDGQGYALAYTNSDWAKAKRLELNYEELQQNLSAAQRIELESLYTTESVYDTAGNVVEKIDPEALITLTAGTAYALRADGSTQQHTHAGDGVQVRHRASTAYVYDINGRHVATQDANARLYAREEYSRTVYNANDLVIQEVHADDSARTYEYDAYGNRISVKNELNVETRYDFDGSGRVISAHLPYDATFAYGVSNSYDGSQASHHLGLSNRTENYTYDQEGRRLSWTNARGKTEYYQYDEKGRLIRHNKQHLYYIQQQYLTTDYTYAFDADSGGYAKTTAGPGTRTLVETSDYHDRLLEKRDLDNRLYSYRYDLAGRLVHQKSDFGSRLSFSELDPNGGGVNDDANSDGYHDDGQNIVYQYYSNGLVKEVIDNTIGTLSLYEYDDNGNRTRERYANTSGEIYQNANAEYDELNRLVHVMGDGSSSGIGGDHDITFEYDANGNRIHLLANYTNVNSVEDGPTASYSQEYWYAYDNRNRFTLTKGALNGDRGFGSIVTGSEGYAIEYDAASQRKSQKRYDTDGSLTAREEYRYNVAGLLTHIIANPDGGNKVYVEYREIYDQVGNVSLVSAREITNSDWGVDEAVATPASWLTPSSSGEFKRERTTYHDNNSINQIVNYKNNEERTYHYYDVRGDLSYTQKGIGTTIRSYYSYNYWDTAKRARIFVQGSGLDYNPQHEWVPGLSEFIYDANGHLTEVFDHQYNGGTGTGSGSGRSINYVLDREGKIIQRHETGGETDGRTQNFYYFNNLGVGDVGNYGVSNTDYGTQLAQAYAAQKSNDDEGYQIEAVTSSDFDYNFQSIDQATGSSPTAYVVAQGDIVGSDIQATLTNIAAKVWGDGALWYLIADANALNVASSDNLTAGQSLVMPNVLTNVHNNDSTFKPYNPSAIEGNVQPTLPDAPPPKIDGGCGFVQILTMVIIAIVVAVASFFTAGAVGTALSGVLGPIFAGGLGTALGSLATTVVSGLVAGAVAGAVGSIAGQLAGMALGVQEGFDWTEVAIGAVTGLATAGIGNGSGIIGRVAAGVTKSFVSQGVNIAFGRQKSIDWTGVAAAGVAAGASTYINTGVEKVLGPASGNYLADAARSSVSAFATDVVHQSTSIAIRGGGEINWAQTAISAVSTGLSQTAGQSAHQSGQKFAESFVGPVPDEYVYKGDATLAGYFEGKVDGALDYLGGKASDFFDLIADRGARAEQQAAIGSALRDQQAQAANLLDAQIGALGDKSAAQVIDRAVAQRLAVAVDSRTDAILQENLGSLEPPLSTEDSGSLPENLLGDPSLLQSIDPSLLQSTDLPLSQRIDYSALQSTDSSRSRNNSNLEIFLERFSGRFENAIDGYVDLYGGAKRLVGLGDQEGDFGRAWRGLGETAFTLGELQASAIINIHPTLMPLGYAFAPELAGKAPIFAHALITDVGTRYDEALEDGGLAALLGEVFGDLAVLGAEAAGGKGLGYVGRLGKLKAITVLDNVSAKKLKLESGRPFRETRRLVDEGSLDISAEALEILSNPNLRKVGNRIELEKGFRLETLAGLQKGANAEFAVIRGGDGKRFLVRGTENEVFLPKDTTRVIAHTHGGNNVISAKPSTTDAHTIAEFAQKSSLIVTEEGFYLRFTPDRRILGDQGKKVR